MKVVSCLLLEIKVTYFNGLFQGRLTKWVNAFHLNLKVTSSNPNGCSSGHRDPNTLQSSWLPTGPSSNNAVDE